MPTEETHAQTYEAGNWLFNVIRGQNIDLQTKEIDEEARFAELEIRAILDKTLEMGDGDIVVGCIKAVEAGVLDNFFFSHPREEESRMFQIVPMKRLGRPEEMASSCQLPSREGPKVLDNHVVVHSALLCRFSLRYLLTVECLDLCGEREVSELFVSNRSLPVLHSRCGIPHLLVGAEGRVEVANAAIWLCSDEAS